MTRSPWGSDREHAGSSLRIKIFDSSHKSCLWVREVFKHVKQSQHLIYMLWLNSWYICETCGVGFRCLISCFTLKRLSLLSSCFELPVFVLFLPLPGLLRFSFTRSVLTFPSWRIEVPLFSYWINDTSSPSGVCIWAQLFPKPLAQMWQHLF